MSEPSSPSFTICSYNIHKGFSAGNRQFLLHDMREAIRSVGADICFLQEVVGHQIRYGSAQDAETATQFEFLADSAWPHYAYGKNAIVAEGHHGNAILSKIPFTEYQNHNISRWQFSQRGLLCGRLGNSLTLICVHLGLLGSERAYQMKRLQEVIEKNCKPHEPVIVAGDFNDWRLRGDNMMRQELGFNEVFSELRGRPVRSFPAALPVLRMDRIYFRGLQLESARALRGGIWRRLSDHAALCASFSNPSALNI
ncbi:EEP domain-containing protein [Halieaceae bacterium IMCC14734]|uniref:EEP domain-containing protein n=1 Tax=Candidatus Litorirhabdus singularis TaxID=2518993 RepID=A0ABT3TL39_9GAMM|nr:endonuclease/exonuclease/phosphatase family protein [Candidatus Litorirhabdus singularis]MCX2983038.1 EEP domain-containing protein [Candidatus Litorirhabdus singularis]